MTIGHHVFLKCMIFIVWQHVPTIPTLVLPIQIYVLTLVIQMNMLMQSNTCAICDSSCVICSGPSASDCLSCQTSQFFFTGSCWLTCPNPYWGVNSPQTYGVGCEVVNLETQMTESAKVVTIRTPKNMI